VRRRYTGEEAAALAEATVAPPGRAVARRILGAAAPDLAYSLAECERERDRLRDILACERGERAPEGWTWSPFATWRRAAADPRTTAAIAWRHEQAPGTEWSWRVDRQRLGCCATALEAIEAADAALGLGAVVGAVSP